MAQLAEKLPAGAKSIIAKKTDPAEAWKKLNKQYRDREMNILT